MNLNDQLVNEYRYSPFGAPVSGFPVQGTTNPLQYMARELDATTGMYYVRNRWYDPQQGRFISEDPIGLAGGINKYAYVGNNPLSFRDPLGLCVTFGRDTWGQVIAIFMGWDEYCPVMLEPIVVTARAVGPVNAGGYSTTTSYNGPAGRMTITGGGRRPRWRDDGVPASCPEIFHNPDVFGAIRETWNRTNGAEEGTFLIPQAGGGYTAIPEATGGSASMPNTPVPPGATINVHSHPNWGGEWLQPLSVPSDTMWGISNGIDTVIAVARDTLSVWSPGAGIQNCARN